MIDFIIKLNEFLNLKKEENFICCIVDFIVFFNKLKGFFLIIKWKEKILNLIFIFLFYIIVRLGI